MLGAARRSRSGGVSDGVGVWGVAGTAGAGDEERALGAMRRSRGDSVSIGVSVVGEAVVAGDGVGDDASGGVGGWNMAV